MKTLTLILVVVLGGLGSSTPSQAASGTDSFGYRWYDSTEPECPFTDVVTVTIPNTYAYGSQDEVSPPIPLGFNFSFYGSPYNRIYISTNGWISFTAPASSFPSPGTMPSGALPNTIVAPLWGDLAPSSISYGLVSNPDVFFVVRWVATFRGRPNNFITELRLYPSGRMTFVYGNDFNSISLTDRTSFVAGIEDPNGISGLMTWNRGVGTNGYTFPGWHSVCLTPPPRMGCFSGPANCNTTTSGTTLGGISDVSGYSCSSIILDGSERAYTLNLANMSDVSGTLSGLGGRNLQLYLLEGCDENRCLDGGGTTITAPLLPAGVYTLAVDNPPGEEGPFSLNVSCVQRGFPATCGSSQPGSISSGGSVFDSYPCAPGDFFPGPESFYEITLASQTNLRVGVTAGCGVDAFVFNADDLAAESCLAHGQGGVTLFDAPAGRYVVVVEGRNGDACPYTVDFDCAVQVNCSSPVATLTCGDVVAGSTVGRTSAVIDYGCRPNQVYDGGEVVYAVTAPAGRSVGARLVNASSPDLEAFLLSSCSEGACIDSAAAGVACESSVASAATRYLVIDGKNGATGTFDVEVVCGPAEIQKDWRTCESPDLTTTLETRAATEWHWYTRIPTVADPAPVPAGSYCGTGCDFAFYLPVNCGNALHLAFQDAESAGSVRLTEVNTARRATLSGTNRGGKTGSDPWTATSQQIEWLSDPCPGHSPPLPPAPADLGSGDPRFNDAVVDLAIVAGESPCGLWRVDLESIGGVHWGLYANCTGAALPGFGIYDNICDAEAAYNPKAELQVSNLQITGTCPNLTASFDLENLGCATLDAPWRIDAGPGSIINGIEIGLSAGAKVSLSRPVVVGGSGKVKALADPDALVIECSEGVPELCSQTGVHSLELQACAGCTTPNPPVLEIGNTVRGRKQPTGAEMSWALAPTLAAANASHFHVYRTDRKVAGVWNNVPVPDSLAVTQFVDTAPIVPLSFYQVRFANDCEEISGPALP